jgi:carboxyl-terminal processing protease
MTIKIPKWLMLSILAFFLSSGSRMVNDLFEFSKNLEIFAAVYKEVGDKYVDEVPPGKLVKTAISSMLSNLDPYTVFFSEYQAEEALIERQGEYGGVGCQVVYRNDYPVVSEVFEGYAFDKAGVKIGDIITSVIKDNETISLKNKNQEEIFQYFRGAPNTNIEITILRGNQTLNKKITRVNVKSKNVPYAGMVTQNIGYIKLDEFGQKCSDEIETELKKLMATTQLKGLVLDLRNNGGGLLNEAVDIVRLFVGNNQLVVTLKGKNEDGPKKWLTQGPAIAPDLPLLVLVNKNSASASEVVSGSLQDLDRAIIVGQTSFGKGLVQNYSNLPYRTQMKITTARYHTPSGRCIQKLQYAEKDENGKATIKKTEDKVAFKTANGRTVFEAGGVDPDVFFPLFGGASMIQWFDKENFIFDWANLYTQNNLNLNVNLSNQEFVSDFEKFIASNAPKQMQKNFPRHAGRSPGRDVSRCNHAGIGKTGFFTHTAVAFKNRDGVSLAGQFVGGAHPDNARTDDSDLHGAAPSWAPGAAVRVYVKIIGFCWREGLVFHS